MHQQATGVTRRGHTLPPRSAGSLRAATIVLVGLLSPRAVALQAVFRRARYCVHIVRDPATMGPLLTPEQGRQRVFVAIVDQPHVLEEVTALLGSARSRGVHAAAILLVPVRCAPDLCDINLDGVAEWIHLPAQPGEILQAVARLTAARFAV